jgi:hypothetical protein
VLSINSVIYGLNFLFLVCGHAVCPLVVLCHSLIVYKEVLRVRICQYRAVCFRGECGIGECVLPWYA